MKKRIRTALTAWLVFGLSISPAILAREQKTDVSGPILNLSLKDCIVKALADNPDLAIETLNPDIDEAAIAQSREIYLPQFSLSYAKQDSNIPGTWGVEGTSYAYRYDKYSVALSQRFVTGGLVSLSFDNSMTNTSRAFTIINPSYFSQFYFSLTQPLLKGFGPKVNRIATLRAANQWDISVSELKSTLIQTIFDVEAAYWNLSFALDDLKVQEFSLEQSRAMLEKNREGARIGSKSSFDVLSSEAEVAAYEDALVAARQAAERSEDNLRKLLNLSAGGQRLEPGPWLIPTDRPVIDKKEITYEDALRIALEERPEMVQAQKEIESTSYDISYYRNQLLPQLDLNFSTWSPGQSGIRNLYLDDNYLTGIIVGQVQGSRADALNEALRRRYKNWSVNLSLTLPLANLFSRASLAKAKLQNEQQTKRLESQKQSIAYEIAAAIKDLRNAESKIKSSTASRELQQKRLEAETRRYELGLVGIDWLLSYQRSLTVAKTSEVRAQIDYKLAFARLDQAMGTTLKSKGIKFRDYDF